MNIAHILFLLFVSSFIIQYIKLAVCPSLRKMSQQTNVELDQLRNKPLKTIEDQKKFLALKYPENQDWLFFNYKSWNFWFSFAMSTLIFVIVSWTIQKVCSHFSFTSNWIITLLIIFLLPYISKKILQRWNLHSSNPLYDVLFR